jgi:hypothetical protein
MTIWSGEIEELQKIYDNFRGYLPYIVKELEKLISSDDPNVVMLYSRRCLEVIITDLCESELKRARKTEPLKGIIDKLNSEEKVPPHIITSMHSLNSLATYGTHPKDFDPEQVKPVLNNLAIIIKWYLKYKDFKVVSSKDEGENIFLNVDNDLPVKIASGRRVRFLLIFTGIIILAVLVFIFYPFILRNSAPEKPDEKSVKPVSFTINSEFGDFNNLIKQRLVQDGYVFTEIDPEYRFRIISDPPGDPVSVNGDADGFDYFYNSSSIRISINDQPPFTIGVIVPKTNPVPSYQEAKNEYRKQFLNAMNNNFEEIYNQIRKHVPEV